MAVPFGARLAALMTGFAQGQRQMQMEERQLKELQLREKMLKADLELRQMQAEQTQQNFALRLKQEERQQQQFEEQQKYSQLFERYFQQFSGTGAAGGTTQAGAPRVSATIGPQGPRLNIAPRTISNDRDAIASANFEGRTFDQLAPEEQQAVNAQILRNRISVQAAAGPAGQLAMQEQGLLTIQELGQLVDSNLQPFPYGTKKADAARAGAIVVTPKQRQEIADLSTSENLIAQVASYADRLIQATDATSALQQGIALQAGAVSKANALAAGYADSKEAFLGVLSRSMGGERGVLTDRDIARVRGMLPGFRDTVAIKNLKVRLLRQTLNVARQAKMQAIKGGAAVRPGAALDQIFAEYDAVQAAQNPNAGMSLDQLGAGLKE